MRIWSAGSRSPSARRQEPTQGVYVPSTQKASQGKKKNSTLDEIIALVNEKYKGEFAEGPENSEYAAFAGEQLAQVAEDSKVYVE